MIPEEYGGFGMQDSPVETCLILEELAYGDMSFAVAATLPSLFIHPLAEMGTEAQKEKYLPLYCGENYAPCTLALQEPHFGFDPLNLKTTATRKNGSFLLNGNKCFVPLARMSNHLMVAASYEGVNNLFIVERENSGVTVGEPEKNLGLNALETNEVVLENCEIPAEDRLGGDNGCDFDRLLQKCGLPSPLWVPVFRGLLWSLPEIMPCSASSLENRSFSVSPLHSCWQKWPMKSTPCD